MKTFFAILLTGAVVGLSGASIPSPAAQSFTLVGQVTDATTGEPLESVEIWVQGQGIGTMTTPEGLFRIVSVEDVGPLELGLRHHCYHTVRVEVDRNRDVNFQRIDIGLPFHNEKYTHNSPPLGGCRRE